MTVRDFIKKIKENCDLDHELTFSVDLEEKHEKEDFDITDETLVLSYIRQSDIKEVCIDLKIDDSCY